MKKNSAVNVFWTGGWDSTFRILQLLITKKKTVQPYYILDPDRKSITAEFNAMKAIKQAVFQMYPYTNELLRPTIIRNLVEMDNDQNLFRDLEQIAKSYSLGSQYSWQAYYCNEIGVNDMELSTQKPGSTYELVSKESLFIKEEDSAYYIMDKHSKQVNLYTLLHYFRFPLLEHTKLDMFQEALECGFEDILELSWFCHRPIRGKMACGTCRPCRIVLEQGLGRRVSFLGHIRYYLFIKTGLNKLRTILLNRKKI